MFVDGIVLLKALDEMSFEVWSLKAVMGLVSASLLGLLAKIKV